MNFPNLFAFWKTLFTSAIRISFFYQFCDVVIVATIQERNEPILITVQRGQAFYFFGEQWQSAKIFSGIIPKSLVLAHKTKKKTLDMIVNIF
jgi:hypothetical protein